MKATTEQPQHHGYPPAPTPYERTPLAASTFVFVEPALLGEIDVTTATRFAAGATWRQAIAAHEVPGITASLLSGPTFVAQLRAGWF